MNVAGVEEKSEKNLRQAVKSFFFTANIVYKLTPQSETMNLCNFTAFTAYLLIIRTLFLCGEFM